MAVSLIVCLILGWRNVWHAVSKVLKSCSHPIDQYRQIIREQEICIGELQKSKTRLEEQYQVLQKVADRRAEIIEEQQAHIAELGRKHAQPEEHRKPIQSPDQGNPYCSTPAVGQVDFGDLRRVKPISQHWGFDRGRPIDRYYIENFLASCAEVIRGRVLEIGDNSYTLRFGGSRVITSDVLHLTADNPNATIIGDLATTEIPSDTFDCIILTQTLQFVYELRTALKTIKRILKPGGILLATFPGITQTYDAEWRDHWYWSFTTYSAKRLFEEIFSEPDIKIQAFGNTLAAVAFLQGLAVEELNADELDYREAGYDVSITVRAVNQK